MSVTVSGIPEELRALRQWVGWRWEERDGKPTKPPYSAHEDALADTTDPKTWGTYEEAGDAVERYGYDGIGFVFTKADPYVGVDLDKCRNPTTGQLDSLAASIVADLNSYAEASVSGAGAHVICKGSLPAGWRKRGQLEMYEHSRFFCMTGENLDGSPTTIEERTAELAALHARFAPETPKDGASPKPLPLNVSDEDLLEKAHAASNGASFAALWRGDTSGYSSPSEAELALCSHLAFYAGGDSGRVDRLFRQSGLIREKWNTRRGSSTYGADTIAKAIAGLTDVYTPSKTGASIPTSNTNEDTPPTTSNAYKKLEVGRGLPIISLSDLRASHSGEVEWIVEGYLARGEVVIVAGAGESLKSWAAVHLATAIDGRFQWLGVFDVNAERVLFLEQERARNLRYQVDRIEKGEGVQLGSDRLRILPPMALPLSEWQTQAQLAATAEEFRPDVVIINALRDVLGKANENSPTDMAGVLGPLGRLAEQYNCAVVVIDHFNKAGLNGVVRGNQAHAGTAQKHAEADGILIAERPRDELGKGIGPATFSTSKRRSGEAGAAFAVSVTDTEDGGVLVRAEKGVTALSPIAQLVLSALADGPALVSDLCAATGKTVNVVHVGLSELRAAGLVDSEGTRGKPHTYWRKDLQPTSNAYKKLEVGHGSANGVHKDDGPLVQFAVEQLGLKVIERRDTSNG